MRLHEVIIAGLCVSVMLLVILCGCSLHQQKVLKDLPSPIVTIHHPYTYDSLASSGSHSHKSSQHRSSIFSRRLHHRFSGIPAAWYPRHHQRKWSAIIVHHSATLTGGARAFDRAHRARGWDELGYDFVIGNGTDTPDGYVEVGPRWKKQKQGAHCKTPSNYYNKHGIGICLVGNFDVQYPSANQLASLKKLIDFLCERYGITSNHIFGHREVPHTHTRCPGKHMPLDTIRSWADNLNTVWAYSGR